MSVVEFSADSWQASSPGLLKGLGRRVEALSELASGLESLAGSDQISGQGADAMRDYILRVHVPIAQSLFLTVVTFQTAVGKYWDGYRGVDTDGGFRLVRDELSAHEAQLNEGIADLDRLSQDLKDIDADAAHLVSLGGAGSRAVTQTAGVLRGCWGFRRRCSRRGSRTRRLILGLTR
ncbi:hypothetical protein G7067_06865 [Leucobacter insecticola]|uniref:Uncharacterized protein n=1 Tax=Leucobacter insecticola TaxID=2714934 RepID=A0A6G8FIK8_9MICO|nr:T7SS effector LXG polymorphic toxin [Leucobacter insecticola]QIM16205.1 hypothetical protein G7067_06865 [Leucobacter insecticola]